MDGRTGVLSIVLSLYAGMIAHGQSQSVPVPSRSIVLPDLTVIDLPAGQQAQQLLQWTRDYQAWRDWSLQWRNRPEAGLFSTRARRLPPVPPPWLPAFCSNLAQESGPDIEVEACAAFREWQANDMAASLMTEQIARTRAGVEKPRKTQWWERVHVDALWPMSNSTTSAFGVAGVHTTMHVTRRFQVFLTPGLILMRLPTLQGTTTWTAAADWGFSYGLFDLRVPVVARPGTVHLNIARVWLLGAGGLPVTGETYLAGFSLSLKQR